MCATNLMYYSSPIIIVIHVFLAAFCGEEARRTLSPHARVRNLLSVLSC